MPERAIQALSGSTVSPKYEEQFAMDKYSSFRSFLKDSSANVTMIFGLSALPLMLAVGIAVDYSNMLDAKTKLQTAVDSAALAAAAEYGVGGTNYVMTAKKYIQTNKPESMAQGPIDVNVTVNTADLNVTVKASGKVDSAFGNLFGTNDSGSGSAENQSSGSNNNGKISSEATVALPIFSDFHKGEIVLVVDFSGSMDDYVDGQRKYVSMRNQVNSLINQLSQNGNNDDVKFGLVPFSEYVRVTMQDRYFSGRTATTNQTRCVEDRGYPYNTQSTTPNTSTTTNSTKWAYFGNSGTNCGSYSTYNAVVRPMSFDHAGTITQMNQMRPLGNTHIALGMEWAYHMLTPNAPFTDAVPLHQADTLKAVVLLTDGAQTSGGYGPSGSWSVSRAEANLATLCSAMKTDGIRVVTVSFDLNDSQNSSSETRLANCASGPQYYFNVETNAQLANAFGTIRDQLARTMYIKK